MVKSGGEIIQDDKTLLPIRIVSYSRDFSHEKEPKWAEKKPFPIQDFKEHQKKLINNIGHIEKKLDKTFKEFPYAPAVLKIQLREDAIAKSHRPRKLFGDDTPIIGLGKIGTLYISATEYGLQQLKKKIDKPDKEQIANITTVENIQDFDSQDRLGGLTVRQLKDKAKRGDVTHLKVILFDHHDSEINQKTKENFISWIKDTNLEIKNLSKLKEFEIWKITGATEQQIEKISKHPLVRELSFFPEFNIILPKEITKQQKKFNEIIPEEGKSYAKVGIIDTGISNSHPFLSRWILDKITYVPPSYVNNDHGSMVGSLLCMASQLNGKSICPDEDNIQLLDVELIPNGDSAYGPVDSITEDHLIERLEEDIPLLSKKYGIKIWNMSASFCVPCEDERFSSLAIFLDKFQDEHDIILTLPSGNYDDHNQRTWPPQNSIGNFDRLQQPGDSVRAITVGAIACKEKPDSLVKINQPASYSCRGPGPSYVIKPDLTHYSGNVSINNDALDFTGQGISVFDKDGSLVETGGTSFSTPLVSRTLSILHHNIVPSPSNILIKALTIHHSYLPVNLGSSEDLLHYVGFGMPTDVSHILQCSQSEITLIFEHEIFPRTELIYPFVWPQSLVDEKGNCRGKVRITLVALPPLDEDYGSEYIRANVTAQLQSLKKTEDGSEKWHGELQEIPTTNDLTELYESNLIENYWKWKPIKRYERTFNRVQAKNWRLKVYLLLRDDVHILSIRPIKFALIFSFSDPKNVAPVYNEVITGLRTVNVLTNEIQLRSRIKQKIRT